MNRPLLTRLMPNSLKASLYYRHYRQRHHEWPHLFKVAPLAFCSHVCMHDLVLSDVIAGNIAFNGFYELDLTQHIARHAVRGGLLVDVGANMGYFSLLWAGTNPANRVVAFEVAPRNLALFQNNVEKNGLQDRVRLVPKAAGDRSGAITFDTGPADQTGWGGIVHAASASTITVPLVRVDQQLPDTDIEVLKIDVEGADTWVLYGCEALLRARRIKTIYFEQFAQRMEALGIAQGAAQKFLADLGYEYHPLGDDQEEWTAFPKAR